MRIGAGKPEPCELTLPVMVADVPAQAMFVRSVRRRQTDRADTGRWLQWNSGMAH